MQPQDILSTRDELNMYLVLHKLKPASNALVTPLDDRLIDEASHSTGLIDGVECEIIRPQQEWAELLRSYCSAAKIECAYSPGREHVVRENAPDTIYYYHDFMLGKDKQSLDKLVNASTSDEEGHAFGYPEFAVENYTKVVDGERRDHAYMQVALARAQQAGMELPTWLAYISFIPDQLDIVGENISSSSEALGGAYREFIAANYPDLAQRIEGKFLNQSLPDSWKKGENGRYTLSFK